MSTNGKTNKRGRKKLVSCFILPKEKLLSKIVVLSLGFILTIRFYAGDHDRVCLVMLLYIVCNCNSSLEKQPTTT